MNTRTNKQQQIKKRWMITIIFLFIGFGASAQQWSSWTPEKYVCDDYMVSYSMRERSATNDKNEVEVKLKYNYSENISVSFRISNDRDAETIYRTTIKSGKTETVSAYVDKGKAWYLIIDKLRVGKDVPGAPYTKSGPCVISHY